MRKVFPPISYPFLLLERIKMEKKIYYYLDKVEAAEKGEVVYPISCEIDPSNMCQCECSFCMFAKYRKENKAFLDWDIYRQLLKDLLAVGTKSITFTGGGEPLTHPKFTAMADMALLAGFEIGLVTNGIGLNKILYPCDYKFIRVSLDAHNSETYTKIKGAVNFHAVLFNIAGAIHKEATVGLSYVVCEENKGGIKEAQTLATELGASYIQFKPAWNNGSIYKDYQIDGAETTIKTSRYLADSTLPCAIAGLVGVVGATGDVFYCCQHRGKERYKLGSLKEKSFVDIWSSRKDLVPNIEKCPTCRYMTYAKSYRNLIDNGTMFFKHKNFL